MTSELVWVLIRQDKGGGSYRVARFASRAEAEEMAGTLGSPLDGPAPERMYVVERVPVRSSES